MTRVWQSPDGNALIVAAKGAPEAIIDLCHLPDDRKAAVNEMVERLANDGLRVLGIARAQASTGRLPEGQHDFAFDFIGLLGLVDPVRPEVPAAVAECIRGNPVSS